MKIIVALVQITKLRIHMFAMSSNVCLLLCLHKHVFVEMCVCDSVHLWMFKLLSVLNVFIMDHFNLPVLFSVTRKGSLHMELDSVSFPPQRSHHNELPVPPLLVMSPAAQSRHKHVTIMLSTLLYPTVHLAMRVDGRARHWWK